MRRIVGLIACAAILGCGSEPTKFTGGDTDTDSDTDTDTDTDVDTDTDTDSDSDTDTDADAGNDSGTANPCTETHELFLLWPDAVVTEPMAMDQNVDPALYYIYTAAADEGTAVITFDLPCDDTWYIWGFAQTGMGWEDTVPNTFYARFDEADELLWNLQVMVASSPWIWNQGGTDDTPWAPALETGAHSLTIRGGQEDWLLRLPKLGPVVLVNDPAWAPDSGK